MQAGAVRKAGESVPILPCAGSSLRSQTEQLIGRQRRAPLSDRWAQAQSTPEDLDRQLAGRLFKLLLGSAGTPVQALGDAVHLYRLT
jgi:hypothetical protein